jgi:capsular polysaccharide biosynthesis protein
VDLLAIFSSLRRHRLIALFVVLGVIGGNAFILFGIPPRYESQAQYVLIAPQAPPTDAQIERDPSLAKLNSNNPYLRLPSSVVVDVLTQKVSGDDVRRDLESQGADSNYQIAPTNTMGNGLIISILGTGVSAAQSRKTLDLVVTRMDSELEQMQTIDGADKRFLYQAQPINAPTNATRKITGTLRSLIAVTAAGVILLFACISVAEAIPARRTRRVAAAGPAGHVTADTDLTMVLPRAPKTKATHAAVEPTINDTV